MAKTAADFISFNDGIVNICTVQNIAENGDRMHEALVAKDKLRFEYRTVGMSRFFEALQAQVKISELIAVPLREAISTQDVAVIGEKQYRIVQIQQRRETLPASLLLSLSVIEEVYDVQ